jgi:hypothetical protein
MPSRVTLKIAVPRRAREVKLNSTRLNCPACGSLMYYKGASVYGSVHRFDCTNNLCPVNEIKIDLKEEGPDGKLYNH